MAIDTDVEVKATFFRRWISVGKMKELLACSELRNDDTLYPNSVGNLSIVRNGRLFIGFIDIPNEGVEIIDLIIASST